mgnify:CR=1 FL=1
MTILQKQQQLIGSSSHDALVDQLRACTTTNEILEFERWYDSQAISEPLHLIICEFLRTRSISRGLAAKWLSTLLIDKDQKIKQSK